MSENAYLAFLIALADDYLSRGLSSSLLNASADEEFHGHGVRLQNVAAVQMGIDMSLSSTKADGDGETTKERHCFSVGTHQVVVDTIAPVNWRRVVELLPFERLLEMFNQSVGPVESSQLQETIDRLANQPSDTTRYSLHTEPNCGDAVDSTLEGVWRAVDGGIATFAVDYQASFKSDEEGSPAVPPFGFFSMVGESTHEPSDAPVSNDSSEAESEQTKLMTMIGYIGLGIDHGPAKNELMYRIVCTPVEGVTVDELESQWTRFAGAALKVLESEDPTGAAAADEFSVKFAAQLLSTQCSHISGADSVPSGIMFTGSTPLPLPSVR